MICLLQKGQRSKIEFGNNTQTEYFYEAKTFRLMQLLTTRNSNTQNPLQDLRYTYDPVGNIVEIYDASKETSYYKNSVIEPRHLFTYDALYRLLSGTGRELLGLAQATSGGYAANSAGAADAKALHTYIQNFAYDELGNIKSIQHQTNTSTLNWTRNYVYDGATNRLLKHDNDQTLPDYTYDAHGNMLTMPHLQSMHYDYQDQLNKVVLDASENKAYYVYDAGGQRVRKVIEKTGGIKEERYYLGNYEVYRKFVGTTLETERTTVAVADDKRKIATIDKLTVKERSLINLPVAVIRYQYDNHLGSASLELDATAQIISYEEYHPFGTTSYRSGKSETEVSLKRYKYVGKEKDEETGLYYYGFRYYAPWIARFINVDPLQHEYPHYTPFQYAGNKPITYVDLDGLEEGKNNHREGDYRIVPNVNLMNAILPINSNYKTYFWHSGTQKKVDVGNEDGTTEKATIGYAPGWYPEDKYLNITKDVILNRTGGFSEGTKFADHWNKIATAAYLKNYENSDKWINPETKKEELNPHSFKGINQDNTIFDVAGFAYGFSLMKIGTKSIANQIPSTSKIVSEVIEDGVEEVATKGVPALRAAYESEVKGLSSVVSEMRAAGCSSEEIARTLQGLRREIGVKYKSLTPDDLLEQIYQRNLQKYGDKLGPTIDYFRQQGKSWDDIINSAIKPGGKDLGF